MSNRNVKFKTTVISPVFGTFNKGDIGSVSAEFAKHVVEEAKVAEYTDEKRKDGKDPALVGAEEAAEFRKRQGREQEKRNREAVDANQKQEAKLKATADATAKGIRTTDHALPASPTRKGDPGQLAPQRGVVGGAPVVAPAAPNAVHAPRVEGGSGTSQAAPRGAPIAGVGVRGAAVAPASPSAPAARPMAPAAASRPATSSTQTAAKASGARAVPDTSRATKGAAKATRGGSKRR